MSRSFSSRPAWQKIVALIIALKILHVALPVFAVGIWILGAVGVVSIIAARLKSGGYKEPEQKMLFSHGELRVSDMEDRYFVAFSDGMLDATAISAVNNLRSIRVNSVFSNSVIKLNPNIPTMIEVRSTFANVDMPDRTSLQFGEKSYVTRSFRSDMPYVHIRVSTAFGQLSVIEDNSGW